MAKPRTGTGTRPRRVLVPRPQAIDPAIELRLLREFRALVLTQWRDAADAVWDRQALALMDGSKRAITREDLRMPKAMRRVQDAAAAVVKADAALQRHILPADGGNGAAMQRHPRLRRNYFAAHDRFYAAIQQVPEWIEVTVSDLVHYADNPDPVMRAVIEQWLATLMPGLYGSVEARKRLATQGRTRAQQRRDEAGHHRDEWRKYKAEHPDDPDAKKDAAAEWISRECQRAGRKCPVRTVREHLKGAHPA